MLLFVTMEDDKFLDIFYTSHYSLIMKLKDLEQQKDYTCGPATIRAWLAIKSKHKIPMEPTVERKAGTTKKYGTLPSDMIKYIESKGYQVHNLIL